MSFTVEVPPDLESGIYANFMAVWSGQHDFTLDFSVTGQPRIEDDKVVVPTQVVSRIKVPLTLAEDILQALAKHVTKFEEAAGPIRKPTKESQ